MNNVFQVQDKEELKKLVDLVQNNEVPPDAPTIPEPSAAKEGIIILKLTRTNATGSGYLVATCSRIIECIRYIRRYVLPERTISISRLPFKPIIGRCTAELRPL